MTLSWAEDTPDGGPDKVRIGGLMRCCLETIDDLYIGDPDYRATGGDKLRCKYASPGGDHSTMVFRDGAWEWDKASSEGE